MMEISLDLFVDLSKAFDYVPHKRLIDELSKMGEKSASQGLTLSDRCQLVNIVECRRPD